MGALLGVLATAAGLLPGTRFPGLAYLVMLVIAAVTLLGLSAPAVRAALDHDTA